MVLKWVLSVIAFLELGFPPLIVVHRRKPLISVDRRKIRPVCATLPMTIEKEMKNVDVAFKFVDGDVIPVGFKEIACHMIFDVKMDLTRKARFVTGGHMTEPPKDSTYSSVVARDSVRIMFLVAALNGHEVLSTNIQNSYLNPKTVEKVFIIDGEKFRPNKRRPALIMRAL